MIRLLPPLILSSAEADEIVAILAPLIKDFLAANRTRMKPGMALIKHYLQFRDFTAEEYAYLFERAAHHQEDASRTTRSTSRWSTARWR